MNIVQLKRLLRDLSERVYDYSLGVKIIKSLDDDIGAKFDEPPAFSPRCVLELVDAIVLGDYGELPKAGNCNDPWLPIEAAPKDGTLVLLVDANSSNNKVYTGAHFTTQQIINGKLLPETSRWAINHGHPAGLFFEKFEPTHFMHIPPTPKL
jgi:hypothetical protein